MLQKMKQWSRVAISALASSIAATSIALAQTQTGTDQVGRASCRERVLPTV